MKKRVLILSTSAGSGHKAAASALEKVFRQSPEVAEVVNKDALDLTNETFEKVYSDLFLDLVKNNPLFIGWWYDESDVPWRTDTVRQLFDQLNAEPLIRFVKDFRPDIVVCTHYMPAGIISQLLAKRQLNATLSIVTTDYDFHSMWLSKLFHRYFVALEETKAHLLALGLPEDRITVSGIPVDPAFSTPVDCEAILAKYHLRPDRPILLLSAGTVGGGPIKAIVDRLMLLRNDVQTVVVCGKNKELRRDLEVFVTAQADKFRVLGYTQDMADLMKVATLFIGKPGGLAVSEAMAVGLPMVVGMPIPGQEERNSDHLLEKGAAIRFNDTTVITYKIDTLLDDPERLQRMRENARRLGRPDAAHQIVATLLSEKDPEPLYIDKRDKKYMAEIARGVASVAPKPESNGIANIVLYDEHTGVAIGAITDAQLQFLIDHLVEEDIKDDDYYINQVTIDMLYEKGASRDLIDCLEKAIARTGEADIRWARRD